MPRAPLPPLVRAVTCSFTLTCSLAGASSVPAQPTPAMFRGGPASTGVVSTAGVPSVGAIAWRFDTGSPVRGSPTLADGRVYVGSTGGPLYALDLETGAEVWRYDAGAAVGGAPLVAAGLVVTSARGNAVHAVEASSGRVRWVAELGADLPLAWGWEGWDYLLPSPVLASDTVLVGSGDGHLYALDLATGRAHWRFATGGRIRSAPAVRDGIAYVGSGDGIVYGVRVADGREVWRFATRGTALSAADYGFDRTQIQATPTLADGTLYLGSRDARLYAVDVESGDERWAFEDGSAWVVGTAALTEGLVISGRSSSGRVHGLDAETGRQRWVVQTGGLVFSSPVVADGLAYVGSGDRSLRAIDVRDGRVVWELATGGAVISTPAVWDGTLVVGSDDGWVYALRAGPAPRRLVYWDDDMMERSVVGANEPHRRIVDHLAAAGYEAVDTAAVGAFLDERADAGRGSVIVFAQDGVPGRLLEGGGGSLLRRYLDTGGKVVWLGYPPGLLVRDPETGSVTGIDRARPTEITGVDHAGWDSDLYGVSVTEAGRRAGLETDWIGRPALGAGVDGITVLAEDELGRPAAWMKSFGGPAGTGWWSLPSSAELPRREEIRWVADLGVFLDAR